MSIRQRALIGGMASLGVVGTALWGFLSVGAEHPATELQIEDTAGIIYAPDLEAAVEELTFFEPTTVAVFTHRGGSAALLDDYALNDATLEHARTVRPDWLSDDEQKWADDLFILGVDPEGRLVGTYFGENRKVPEDTQLDIQEATKDDFRRGHWTEGTIAGIESAAGEMNQPFARSGWGIAVGSLASLGTLAASGIYLLVGASRRSRSRSDRAAGDRAMANVVRDYDVTQVHANLIPEQSRYGGAMLGHYEKFTAQFRELTELGNRARGIPESAYDSPDTAATMAEYSQVAGSLDSLDDVIADTAALLNLDQAWPQAWERQVASLRKDLKGVDGLLSTTLDEELRGLDAAQPLREFASDGLAELDRLKGRLDAREISPDDALDALRDLREGLSGHLDSLAGDVAREVGETEHEKHLIRSAISKERVRREPTILSTTDHRWSWITIDSFNTGYASGTSQVQGSRSSSGGSSSGYSSGGSFSGAGSSSRF